MGASASLIPMNIDKETFQRITGGTFNDHLFDTYAIAGVISRDKLIELSQTRDCFLSHNWGPDTQGRDNHARVARISQGLKVKGFSTHFEDVKVEGSGMLVSLIDGVDKSRCIINFVTQFYMDCIGSKQSEGSDNCNLEFNYAIRRKSPQQMIVVIMEPHLKDKR
jgi:hypothetical protein